MSNKNKRSNCNCKCKCLPCVADVSHFESADIGTLFPLKKPAGAVLRKARLEDTIYKDYPASVNGWGKFFLPNTVTMKVVGVVEGCIEMSCMCDQLVLMTCEEDQQMYVYDEEELHLVASSFKQLLSEGMDYPASKTYYDGEAFKDMTKEDWEQVFKGPVGRRLDEEFNKFLATLKPISHYVAKYKEQRARLQHRENITAQQTTSQLQKSEISA